MSLAQFFCAYKSQFDCQICLSSIEYREYGCHSGKTKTTTAKEDEDLSIGVLVEHFSQILQALFPDPAAAPTLLYGRRGRRARLPPALEHEFRISGLAVLNVVEGPAMEALPHMHNLLNARADGFDSPEATIQWHVETKTIRNANSARVSVPAIVVPAATPTPTTAHAVPLDGAVLAEYARWFTGLSGAFLAGKFHMIVVTGLGHVLYDRHDHFCDPV
ncbi:hypothetical protein B0H10DRAFT_2435214 [Mycena sp. CBHHK59/15]|nr:hypothetical protein B0H10DRAFT_2435214 [Mycena sp. CBHHK59/15]